MKTKTSIYLEEVDAQDKERCVRDALKDLLSTTTALPGEQWRVKRFKSDAHK